MGKKAAVHNLGCKVNAYESEAIQQLLQEAGYEIVPFAPGADVYIINTCTVTNIADRKSRQMLHKAKKMNPGAIVVAAGCYAQTDSQKLEKDDAIDLIIGNNCKHSIVEMLEQYEKEEARLHKIDLSHSREFEPLFLTETAERVRAYIKVQDGCNQFCTYCIIPFARGRVRSRQHSDILQEIRTLAERGIQEVVLTGIHLSSYGVDFPEGQKETLLHLIQAVHEVPGIQRIRLGSLEPGIITEEFAKEISLLPKLCPHFHLSLQSGCDATLKRMNRRYRAGQYREKCDLLREVFEDPALTTDVIVGFPMETEEEFEASRAFVSEIHFYETHIFKYSRRQGTKAAAMPGQLTEAEKSVRSDILLELNEQRRTEYEKRRMGKPMEVLLEEEILLEGKRMLVGYSREYVKAVVPADAGYSVNQIVTLVPAGFAAPHILAAEPRMASNENERTGHCIFTETGLK